MFKVLKGYIKRRFREYHHRTRRSLSRRLIIDAIIENVNQYLSGHKRRTEFAHRHRALVRSLTDEYERDRRVEAAARQYDEKRKRQ